MLIDEILRALRDPEYRAQLTRESSFETTYCAAGPAGAAGAEAVWKALLVLGSASTDCCAPPLMAGRSSRPLWSTGAVLVSS